MLGNVVWYGATAVALQVASTWVLIALLNGSPVATYVRLPQVVGATLVVVVVLPLATRLIAARWRRYDEWLSLEIGP
jgi:hypothetical protein